MKPSLFLACLLAMLSGPALAGHANPWATEDDVVHSKNHDANQIRSVDTPGEDEMRGTLTRSAHGKLDGGQRSGGKGR